MCCKETFHISYYSTVDLNKMAALYSYALTPKRNNSKTNLKKIRQISNFFFYQNLSKKEIGKEERKEEKLAPIWSLVA